MSIPEKILTLLETQTSKYKGVPINCFGLPVLKEYKKQSIRNALNKLHSQNYINYNNSLIEITKGGEKYLENKRNKLKSFGSPFKDKQDKNLLVLFDITEERKTERDWLRRHLIKFGYFMIQRSVWVGPSPLPKEFILYIKKIKLEDSIKTFKLAKPYNIK